MGHRISVKDALARGLISKDLGEAIRQDAAQAEQKFQKLLGVAPPAAPRGKPPGRSVEPLPQERLYQALAERLPGRVIQEKTGLVPGRRFRADIFIEPDIVVELDGFQYHSSLDAFQTDRERKNLIEAMGYRVFHAYTGQVKDDDARSRLVELIVMTANGMKPTREQCIAGLLVKKK